MQPTSGVLGFLAASFLAACSGGSSIPVLPDAGFDAGTLYGLCAPVELPRALLNTYMNGNYGSTVPTPAGESRDVTMTVVNVGSDTARHMTDRTPDTPALSYRGGLYPGSKGTCAGTLRAGASCTLDMILVGPPSGDKTSLVIIEYDNGVGYSTDTHIVHAVATEGPFVPSKHAPLPRVPSHGGGVLRHVHMVTATFADTPDDSAIDAFGDSIVQSDWWRTVGADYGVDIGTHEHVRLAERTPTTMTDAALSVFVDEKVAEGVLPDHPESVYVVFASTGVTVTDVSGAAGWHSQSLGGHAYAMVTAGCAVSPEDVVFDSYTFIAAHELIEAATDPAPYTGFSLGFGEGEVGDLCNQVVTEGGYALPTVWSTSAASAAKNPCVPAIGAPYVDVDSFPSSLSIQGVAGESVELAIDGWSTDRVGDWVVKAEVVGPYADLFTATFDRAETTTLINDGRRANLTLTNHGTEPAGAFISLELLSFAESEVTSVRGAVGTLGVRFVRIQVTGP